MKNWKFAALAAAFALMAHGAEARVIELDVKGMVCANCVAAVEKELATFATATDAVHVDLEKHLVAIELKDGKDIENAALEKAVGDAGFAVTAVRRHDSTLAEVRAAAASSKK